MLRTFQMPLVVINPLILTYGKPKLKMVAIKNNRYIKFRKNWNIWVKLFEDPN